mmetsp:Transcript_667/g.1033  ORF Transcript_667/g.1033 Transcript_667/m.1033 type:complete len:314 (+) Transcript_667:173-1114(+)
MCGPTTHETSRKEVECIEHIPLLIQPLVKIYRSTPKVHFPGTKIDIVFTLLSSLFLYGSFAIGQEFLIQVLGWPRIPLTREAATSIGAIAHSTVLVPSLGVLLATQKFIPSAPMKSHPQWWQDAATALLQLCTGYMIYDSINSFLIGRWVSGEGVVLIPGDVEYLGHHFATSFYMMSCLYIGAGHLSAMILMFTGEFTNPINNIFLICRMAMIQLDCCNGPWLQAVYPYIELTFAWMYAVFRIFCGPMSAALNTYDIVFTKEGRSRIPALLIPFWLIMSWGVLIGSIPWIIDCIDMIKDGLVVKYHKDYDGEL